MVALTQVDIRNLTLLLASSLTVMAGTVISPALPKIYAAFADHEHADLLVKLTLTLPALFIAISAPFIGILLDKWGRKHVLTSALGLFAVAGASGFWLSSLEAILVGRALFGIAVAGVMSAVTTLIGDYFEGMRRVKMLGKQGAFTSFGGVLFLLGGGYLADIGWQYPFLIYLVALALLPGVIFAVQDVEKKTIKASSADFGVINFRLLLLIYAITFLVMALFYLLPVQIAFYLTAMEPISATKIGGIMAICSLVTAFTSLKYHKITKRLSLQSLFVLVYLVMGTGFVLLSLANNSAWVLLSVIVIGFGFGWWIPNVNAWLMSSVPDNARGKAVGGFTMVFFIGPFASPLLSQPMINAHGLGATFISAGGLLVLLAILAYRAQPSAD